MTLRLNAHAYVPILKCKRGEKKAVELLHPLIRQHVVPLFEIVEISAGKAFTDHLVTSFKGLELAVPPGSLFFLDCREVSGTSNSATDDIYAQASTLGLTYIPVTGVSRPAHETTAALKFNTRGLCLRLTRSELEKGLFPASVPAFLQQHSLHAANVDLLLDLGATSKMIVPGVASMAHAFMQAIPNISGWRNLIIAGTAFPKSMGVVQTNHYMTVPRVEWLTWRDHVYGQRASLPRVPTFGDCAIQHPAGVEGFDPRIMQVSAAVRYALGDNWLLMKGQSTKSVKPGIQFPNLARLLAPGGKLNQSFAGQQHCQGCASIVACAGGTKGLSSAEVWRRIGTIHHMTVVVQDLTSLPVP